MRILTEYYGRGFDQAAVNVTQQPEPADPAKVDVVFHINEGQQTFVRNVLLTGLEFTRPQTVARAITAACRRPAEPVGALRHATQSLLILRFSTK